MCLLHKQSINFLGRISNNLDTMRISALILSKKPPRPQNAAGAVFKLPEVRLGRFIPQ